MTLENIGLDEESREQKLESFLEKYKAMRSGPNEAMIQKMMRPR
jgi:hypothetical protein